MISQARLWAPKIAIALAAAILLAKATVAATISVHAPDGEGRVFVDVLGTINDEDFKVFQEKTDQIYPSGQSKKQVVVTLLSYGGSVRPALQIAELIRKRGMSTFVPGDRTCTSSCALIWLAGMPRIVGNSAEIGFHAIYDPTTRQATGPGNAIVGAYLRDLGFGVKAIVFMTRKGPSSVDWLTPDLAKEFGVTWTTLQPPRAIPIPPQPNQRPSLRPPPQIIAAWSRATNQSQQQSATAAPPGLPPSSQDDAACRLLGAPGSAAYVTCRQHFEKQVAIPPTAQLMPPSADPPGIAQPLAAPKVIDRFEAGQNASTAQKAVLYEEDPASNGQRFVGAVKWRMETLAPQLGQPAEPAVIADIELPERKLALSFTLRRNTHKGLPATHTIEVLFKFAPNFPGGGVSNVPGILMKQGELTRGVPLAGLSTKVSPGFYLIGLSNQEADKARNLQLLKERGWFDIPVVYNNNRRAIVAIEKGTPGDLAFADAFRAWERLDTRPTWKSLLINRLEQVKFYPADARERKEAGVAQVFFSLNRKGELVSNRIVRSSGYPSLDNAALETIRRGQPFAPPPAELKGEEIDLTVPIRFNWRDPSLTLSE